MDEACKKTKIFGIFGEFADPESLLSSAIKARKAGYSRLEAFSPYPVEGLYKVLRLPKDRVALITLLGALFGGACGFFMQWYANVIDYPIDVGGKPDNSWQSFIPITFELTILGGALSAAIGMLALNRLPEPYHAMFNAPEFLRASKDGFFLCIKADDPRFEFSQTWDFLSGLNPRSLGEISDED